MWKAETKIISVKFKLGIEPRLDFLGTGKFERVTDFYYDNAEYSLYSNGHSLVNLGNKWVNFNLKLSTFEKMRISKTSFFFRLFQNYRADLERIFRVIKIDYNNKWAEFTTFLKAHNFKVLVSLGQFKQTFNIDDKTTIVLNKVDDIGMFLEINKEVEKTADDKAVTNELIKQIQSMGILSSMDEYITESYVDLYLKKFDMLVYNKRRR